MDFTLRMESAFKTYPAALLMFGTYVLSVKHFHSLFKTDAYLIAMFLEIHDHSDFITIILLETLFQVWIGLISSFEIN